MNANRRDVPVDVLDAVVYFCVVVLERCVPRRRGSGRFVRGALRCAFGALLFAPSSAWAFRTAADLPELAGAGPIAWETPPSFRVSGEVPPAYQGRVTDVLNFAFAAWTAPECSAVSAIYEGVTGAPAARDDGLNTVEWIYTDWSRFALDAEAAAFTDVQYTEVDGVWRITEADVYLNAESYDWVPGGAPSDGAQDAATVLTHELGHAFGVLHPCEPDAADGAPLCGNDTGFRASVMYPFYEPGQVELSADDVAAICSLYPETLSCDEECPIGSVCTARGCVEMCGDAVCAAGETCNSGACVPESRCDAYACLSGSCAAEPACAAILECDEGACARGTAVLGDPCMTSQDCATAACGVTGHCAPPCRDSADCDGGAECDPATHACVQGEPLGAACTDPAQCLGGQCVLEEDGAAVCSRPCGAGRASCADGWMCEVVDDLEVCVPERNDGCGCSVPGADSRVSGEWAIAALVAAIMGRRSWRGRRQAGRG